MPSTTPSQQTGSRAEAKFRDAFERLKRGKPTILAKGTIVSQNNVAREAGVDPSALRRVRFPVLVAEIQKWIEKTVKESPSKRRTEMSRRAKNRGLREQLEVSRAERDDALSKLVDAEATIVDLVTENRRLRAQLPPQKVTPLRSTRPGPSGDAT